MSEITSINAKRLERFVKNLGGDLFGIADMKLFRPYAGLDQSLLDFPFGLSIGVRLSNVIVDRITVEDPTPEYASQYRAVNALLDDMTVRVTGLVQRKGYAALPIPASQITKPDLHMGAISHKAVAAIAGLGWTGRSQLLVTPRFGPRLRLATILTNTPLKAGRPMKNGCGECEACIKACPTQAIKPSGTEKGEWVREEIFDADACYRRLIKFRDDPRYGVSICGLCVRVCPFGKRSRR